MTDAARLAGRRVVRSFEGTRPTPGILDAIARGRAGGVALYRGLNVESPDQLARLTAALQAARPRGDPPLLIALDQEGGQLQAFGEGATPWPGNLALGAAGSTELAERAASAIGRELAAVGVNTVWAPVCDLLLDQSVVLGTRPFGDDAVAVGELAAATVRGFRAAGVAATMKHVPGHGTATADSHYDLPVVEAGAAELERHLVPVAAAVGAEVPLAMVAHVAVPTVVGDRTTPATFAPAIVEDVLRDRLGFRGVSVSDALNMGALGDLSDAPRHAVRGAAAGLDLLLLLHPPDIEDAATRAVGAAIADRRIAPDRAAAAEARIERLRRGFPRPDERDPRRLAVVGCAEHRALAREIAEASVTLVRDSQGSLPLSVGPVLVVAPRPVDLTPADTSSYLQLGLADALRERGLEAESLEMPLDPSSADVHGIVARAAGRTVICGTIDAAVHRGQAALVEALLAAGRPTVAVALRTPYDLVAYPSVGTYACTFGIQPPSIEALADALVGRIPFRGRLPVVLPMDAVAA
ncbi:MAG TPA: glycoside hydrolase family 3 N-terminal domain-containing protein [Candidatus Limnocylindrales bacterium]